MCLVSAGVLLSLVGTLNSASNNSFMTADNAFETSLRNFLGSNLPQYEHGPQYCTDLVVDGLSCKTISVAAVTIAQILGPMCVHSTILPALNVL